MNNSEWAIKGPKPQWSWLTTWRDSSCRAVLRIWTKFKRFQLSIKLESKHLKKLFEETLYSDEVFHQGEGDFSHTIRAYILKAEKVAVMAILANKNWRKKCVNLDKTRKTKARKSWKWKELSTCCWNKASFLNVYCLYCLYMDRNYNKLLK